MKRALAVMMVLSACGMEEAPPVPGGGGGVESAAPDTALVVEEAPAATHVAEALVVDLPLDADPITVAQAVSCIDIPDELTLAWLRDRLVYHQGCFESWAVSVGVSDCPIGGRLVSGEVVVAGTAMTEVPADGFLIRSRAASAALLDLAAVATGDTSQLVELGFDGLGVSMGACSLPVTGGRTFDLDLVVEHPHLGVAALGGAGELTRIDGVRSVDFLFTVSAEPGQGPVVEGELSGTGIELYAGDLCPDAGEIRFAGSIGATAAEILASYLGDGEVVVTLPDGQVLGPYAPPRCGQ